MSKSLNRTQENENTQSFEPPTTNKIVARKLSDYSDIISENENSDSDVEIIEQETTVIELDDDESMNTMDVTLIPTDKVTNAVKSVTNESTIVKPTENVLVNNNMLKNVSDVSLETNSSCEQDEIPRATKTNPWREPIQCTLISSCLQTKEIFSNINKNSKKTNQKRTKQVTVNSETTRTLLEADAASKLKYLETCGTLSSNEKLNASSTSISKSTINTTEIIAKTTCNSPTNISTILNVTICSNESSTITSLEYDPNSTPVIFTQSSLTPYTSTLPSQTAALPNKQLTHVNEINLPETSDIMVIDDNTLFYDDHRGANENEVLCVPLYDSISSADSFFDKTLTPTNKSARKQKSIMPTIDLSDSISIDNYLMPSPSVSRKRKSGNKLDDSVVFVSETLVSIALDFIPIPKEVSFQ